MDATTEFFKNIKIAQRNVDEAFYNAVKNQIGKPPLIRIVNPDGTITTVGK